MSFGSCGFESHLAHTTWRTGVVENTTVPLITIGFEQGPLGLVATQHR